MRVRVGRDGMGWGWSMLGQGRAGHGTVRYIEEVWCGSEG